MTLWYLSHTDLLWSPSASQGSCLHNGSPSGGHIVHCGCVVPRPGKGTEGPSDLSNLSSLCPPSIPFLRTMGLFSQYRACLHPGFLPHVPALLYFLPAIKEDSSGFCTKCMKRPCIWLTGGTAGCGGLVHKAWLSPASFNLTHAGTEPAFRKAT